MHAQTRLPLASVFGACLHCRSAQQDRGFAFSTLRQ
jgi:hypothetical protein